MEPTGAAVARVGAVTPPATRRQPVRSGVAGVVRFVGRGILLDIEGTLCAHSYFHDVLETYARRHIAGYLREHWFDGAVARVRDGLAQAAGGRDFDSWCGTDPGSAEAFVRLYEQILLTLKLPTPAPAVAELLELTWRNGYRESKLCSHVFPDVLKALQEWVGTVRSVCTFSRVSLAGQCALLSKTERGNLLGYVRDHFDEINPGPKLAPGSYCMIADELGLSPGEILYVSANAEQLDAARIAGLQTAFIARSGNPPPPPSSHHPVLKELRAIFVG